MQIGKKLVLSFLAVIIIHLIAYQLVFKNIIVEQIKNDRHEEFLQEREAAKLVRIGQLMRSSSFKDPTEARLLSERLPEDLMYKVTVQDGNGQIIYSKESRAYNLQKSEKQVVAEYHFQHEPPRMGGTVVQFFTNETDILASKGVSMIILYIYGSIFLIGLVLVIFLVRWILQPINELSAVIQQIRDGKRNITFSYQANDEFGQLFRYFSDMVEQLRISEERQHELISAIAHDFRTPLTTIRGYASYLSLGRFTDLERIQKQTGKIEQKAIDLERLLDELQEFSKVSDHVPLVISRIHIRSFISSIVEEYTERTKEAGLSLTTRLRVSQELHIEADETKLRRVLANLLDNAIYYNKPDGSILLTVDQREHHVLFSVIDKGEGIAEEDLPKVFTKFYRADKSRNRNNGGTGLGLSICQRIVESHGGEINVISHLGEGSCFWFTIPYHQ
ncbi:HAMP domain-containing histidine kinase [Brevibacillus humidisoli]|uniref:sensor histidine kinase n=1 Tax=Brevibacillus humidisoli TaxID=2895522 RepID=UPI001E56020D|nr:HAMP domain-containing sensor histidine kinase [Brevibacillus humidisoli]UFJ41253.1 HAMP domain-containing histidine kinase [Brevibacillus humidisoli]